VYPTLVWCKKAKNQTHIRPIFSCPEQLYTWPCLSVGCSVCQSVCRSVGLSVRVSCWNFVPCWHCWQLLTFKWPNWPWTDRADLRLTLLTLDWPCWPCTDLDVLKLTLSTFDWSCWPCWPWTNLADLALTLLTLDCPCCPEADIANLVEFRLTMQTFD